MYVVKNGSTVEIQSQLSLKYTKKGFDYGINNDQCQYANTLTFVNAAPSSGLKKSIKHRSMHMTQHQGHDIVL